MGILIEIRKMCEVNNQVYYRVSSKDFGGDECYMGIDKEGNTINFYLTDHFDSAVLSVDLNKPEEAIQSIPGVQRSVMAYALLRGIKSIRSNSFPDILDYAA